MQQSCINATRLKKREKLITDIQKFDAPYRFFFNAKKLKIFLLFKEVVGWPSETCNIIFVPKADLF